MHGSLLGQCMVLVHGMVPGCMGGGGGDGVVCIHRYHMERDFMILLLPIEN